MKFDIKQKGLQTLFKPYQVLLLEHLWNLNKKSRSGISSAQAYSFLQEKPEKKSRTSIIFFFNDMVDEGILEYEEKTGKGGVHRIYYPTMNREEFALYIKDLLNNKLKETFPETNIL